MKKALVFYNPKAGLMSEEKKLGRIKGGLHDIGLEPEIIRVNDYFYRNVKPKKSDYDLVIAGGGDGTIRLAANWILKNNKNLPLGILPLGSGNLFAETVGIPIKIEKALQTIKQGKKTRIDVGLVNDKEYFVLSFSFGHMAEVVGRTPIKDKRKLGFWAYWKNFFFRRIKLWDFSFEVDGKEFNVSGNNFFIFNAIRFMGFTPKKNYDYQDGILDAFITTNRTFFGWWISALLLLIFKKPPAPAVFTTSGKIFKIYPHQARRIKAQFDGDRVDLDQAVVRVVPKALNIIIP
jgi:diacylglycerol kinase (ATP)